MSNLTSVFKTPTTKMSWRSIFVTLFAAIITSIICATVVYTQVVWLSDRLHQIYLPLEPCVLNAVFAAISGSLGYWLQLTYFPNRRLSADAIEQPESIAR